MAILITITLLGNLDFLIIFIYPVIVIFQLIFIVYWTFRLFSRKKAGLIITGFLTVGFLLILLQPWISDRRFSKKDARKTLLFHGIELKDDFKILKNESGGFRDFYETFTLKISDDDFNNISERIKTSKNYKGLFTDYTKLPSADYQNYDTLNNETPNRFAREYFSKQKMNNGTYHFRMQLDKQSRELSYIGSDE